MANDEREFSKAVKDFKDSNKSLKKTMREQSLVSSSIAKEVGTVIKEDITQFGKDVKDFAGDIAGAVPGLRSVAGIAGAVGKGIFGDIALGRQEKILANQLGLTQEEVKLRREQKELLDAQKAQQEQLQKAAEQLGMSTNQYLAAYGNEKEKAQASLDLIKEQKQLLETQKELAETSGDNEALAAIEAQLTANSEEEKVASQSLLNALMNPPEDEDQSAARQKEESNERKRESEESQNILQGIVKGIGDLNKSFMEGLAGLADKGGFGLGVIAAVIAAPVVALVSFFKQLAVEFKFIKDLASGGKLAKIFAPLKRVIDFFKILGSETKAFLNFKFPKVMNFTPIRLFVEGIGKYFKILGDIAKGAGNILKSAIGPITKGITYVKDLFSKVFAPISRVMDGIGKTAAGAGRMAKFASSFLQGLQPILGFAAGFGRILGKVFAPITIIVGIFDFFSAATEEYQDSGSIMNALTAGIGGAIGGFFGMLLDLPKSIISWLFEAFLGEGNIISTALDSFSFTDVIANIVDYGLRIMLAPITFVKNLIGNLFGGVMDVFGGFFDILYGIFTLDFGMIWEGVTGMLGGIWDIVMSPFTSMFETIGEIFDFDWWGIVKSIPGVGWLIDWWGGDEETEESNKEAMDMQGEAADRATEKRELTQRAAEQDNIYINGQKANEEQKQAAVQKAMDEENQAYADYAEAVAKYEESIMSNTLPEYLGDVGAMASEGISNIMGGISDWWSGSDDDEIAKLEEEKQKALAEQNQQNQAMWDFMSPEEREQKMAAIEAEYDAMIAAEEDKGKGALSGITSFFSTAGGLLPSEEEIAAMSEEEKAAYQESLEAMQNPLGGLVESATGWLSSWWSGDEKPEETASEQLETVSDESEQEEGSWWSGFLGKAKDVLTIDPDEAKQIADYLGLEIPDVPETAPRTAALNEYASESADDMQQPAPIIVDNSVRSNNTSNNAPLPMPKHSANPDAQAVRLTHAMI